MAQIFISYHNQDKELVDTLVYELKECGHIVVYAGEALTPGSGWRSEIQKQLASSDVTISVITQNSIKSEWVIAETSAAMAYVFERGKGAVIPVVFDEVELPKSLQEVQAIFANRQRIPEVTQQIDKAIDSIFGRQIAKDEKRREKQEKIEKTAEEFIRESQKELKEREQRYRLCANFWYGAAYLALAGGLAASVWRASIIHNGIKEWLGVVELAIISILLIAMILAMAKFAFTLGKSYMVEALRNADRSHAISFGEFYLKAFGDNLDWSEVKDAFQHWNIDKGSSFLTQNTKDFDPKLLETAIELAKAMSSIKTSGNKNA